MKLSLTNFRRYKEQTFSLATSVIKVTGESGSGKSTLLDSVYYVLYGKLQKVKPRDSNGQTEVVMEFPYKDSTITIRRRNRMDVTVWIDDDSYQGDQAQGIIDSWFGTSDSFLVSSYLKAETMHKFISATASEKKEITYLLFPGVSECEKHTNSLKEARKKEEDIMSTDQSKSMRLNSSIQALMRNAPWLEEQSDIEIEDMESILHSYGLVPDTTYTDVQKMMKNKSSILGRYETLQEQCTIPSYIDEVSILSRIDFILERLKETSISYVDIRKRIGDCSSIFSRYKTMLEDNKEPEPSGIDEMKSRILTIDNEIELKKKDICEGELPYLMDIQSKIKECYSVLGRYEVLLEHECPSPIDEDGIISRIEDLRESILSSRVGTESRESKLSYLRGTLESLSMDFDPSCIKDYSITRRLHALCQSYEVSKKSYLDMGIDVREREITLKEFEESLSAIEYNSRLSNILNCPSCGISLRHTDKLCPISEEDLPKSVLYKIDKSDVDRARVELDSSKKKMNDLGRRIQEYEELLNDNEYIIPLLEKHISPALYNRYITDMKNRKERIDGLISDIDIISNDNTKYISQEEIDIMKKECSLLESNLSSYRHEKSRYDSSHNQVVSLLEKNPWLKDGNKYIRELEDLSTKLHELGNFISSCKDEKDSLNNKIDTYETHLSHYNNSRRLMTELLSANPWLVEGEEYILSLEKECESTLERQREDERMKKECMELENVISTYRLNMSSYLSQKSKVDDILLQHPWLEDGEAHIQSLDLLSHKILEHAKRIEMKKVHISYMEYKNKLIQVDSNIKSTSNKIDSITRLLALVNEAYRIYVDDKMKEIEYDISTLGKIFFDESMNITIVSDKGERPSFDLNVEYEGIVYDDIKSMSTGERKRLSLILMIVICKYLDGKIMMLDEAFSSIGMDSRGIILNEIAKLGIPLLISSHDSIPGGYYEELVLDDLPK